MAINELIYLIIWVLGSFGIAFCLFKKVAIFKKFYGFSISLLISIISVFLHNIISGLFKFEEPVFFFLTFFSFGVAFFLFWIWLIDLIRKKLKKE